MGKKSWKNNKKMSKGEREVERKRNIEKEKQRESIVERKINREK